MKKLGIITIGQSPRDDVVPEMIEFIGENVEVFQAGALDGLEYEEIKKFVPEKNDYVLVSRLRDGRSVKFAERHILSRLQDCIEKLETKKVDIILFICTGVFPDIFKSSVPILYPQKIIHGLVPNLLDGRKLAVITPDKEQIEQSQKKWEEIVAEVDILAASPYSKEDQLSDAIEKLNSSNASLIVMDCMGYNKEMKDRIEQETGKMVISSRTIVARVIGELLTN